MQKLFVAFSQIDSSLARRFEGTGLGLAMVKQLAELHGGTVAVASEEGVGACFAVWLPLRQSAAIQAPLSTPRASAIPHGERTALVVEDDELAADLIRLLLEADGFSVIMAGSAEAALAMVPRPDLSLITVDIQLPGIDGWEFLLRIREIPVLADVPVVIIAGVADRNLALASGAVAVLQKPISRPQLKAALAHLKPELPNDTAPTILVVDDDPRAVDVIAQMLMAPAYNVVKAYRGEDAIELAQTLLPDLILLDLTMPDVSGFDVVNALKNRPDTAHIPVLFLTAEDIAEHQSPASHDSECVSAPMVARPEFSRRDFMKSVRHALEPNKESSGTWPEF